MTDTATVSVRCLRCDYDLRGLTENGRCPECGVPVWRSLAEPTELRHAPPGWLGSLTWGAGLATGAMLGYAVHLFLSTQLSPWPFLQFNLLCLVSLVFVAGVWLLTRRQRRFGPSGVLARWSVRALALSILAAQACTYLIFFTGDMRYIAISYWFALPVALLPLVLFRHAQRIARRLRGRSLCDHAGIVGVGFTTCVLLTMAISLAADRHWFRGGRPPEAAMVGGALIVVFYLWGVVTLARLTFALRSAWRASRDTWDPVEA